MIIAGALARPFLFQVNYSHDGGITITLGKDNPHPLVVAGKSFHGIAWTAAIFEITFFIIDLALLHDLLYFCHRYLAAIHTTTSMIAVLQEGCPTVEAAVAVDGCVAGFIIGSLPASYYENGGS